MRGPSQGLKTTLELLSTTENEAAVRALVAALDSPHAAIRDGAFEAILARRSPAGFKEFVRRLHTFGQRWMDRLRDHSARLRQALRDAVLGTDLQVLTNGCRAAVWLGEYDLVPTLLKILEDVANPNVDLVAATMLELVVQLDREVRDADSADKRRDPRLARPHVLTALETAVERFPKHRRREVLEAFVLLASRENATLKRILQNPHHPAFLALIDVLSKGQGAGTIGLLLGYLDDPHAPTAAISVVANRSDPKFLRYLLRKVGRGLSPAAAQNLKRVRTVPWLRGGAAAIDGLEDHAQLGAVRLAMAAGIPRQQAYGVIEHLVLRGKPEGRRAAAQALAEFPGAAANALALKALEDPDPQVKASIAPQLRQRGIPGVLPRLVEMLESPHAVVRQAARKSLSEFNFARFLGAFDMLDEDVRRTTGALVRKIDPQTLPRLREELHSDARGRRLRAVAVARCIDAVELLEPLVIELLSDEDHMVRAEAAAALAQCGSELSRRALRRAEADRSPTVQQAARSSLDQQDQFAYYREKLADPRD